MKTKIQPYLIERINGVRIKIKISFSDVEQIKIFGEFSGIASVRKNRFIETYFDKLNERTIVILFEIEETE